VPGDQDAEYLKILTDALEVCRSYRPRFGSGQESGLELEEFQRLYREDPFYAWLGLDDALVYAAHRAAGGITSIYRQIGMGCQRLFNQVLRDSLGLDAETANWSYRVSGQSGDWRRALALDAHRGPKRYRTIGARKRCDFGSQNP